MIEDNLTDAKAATAVRPPGVSGWLTRPRAWISGGIVAVAAGLALNWDWLTAVGIAPILLAVLPCAAMCALGLCMRGGAGKDCSGGGETGARDPLADRQRRD